MAPFHRSSHVYLKLTIPIPTFQPGLLVPLLIVQIVHPMTPPPAQRAEHHHDPHLMHKRLVRHNLPILRPRLPDWGDHPRQVIPVLVRAFSDPVAHPGRVETRFVSAQVLPGVPPIVDGLPDVGLDEVGVAELVVALKTDEVVRRVIVASVDSF